MEKPATPTAFKCDDCQAEVTIIGSDNYQEELRQRAAFKKELAQMENKEEVAPTPKVAKTAPENPVADKPNGMPKLPKEENPKRQAFKDQIAQAIAENKQAEKQNHAPN
jgi:hypothetical protein